MQFLLLWQWPEALHQFGQLHVSRALVRTRVLDWLQLHLPKTGLMRQLELAAVLVVLGLAALGGGLLPDEPP